MIFVVVLLLVLVQGLIRGGISSNGSKGHEGCAPPGGANSFNFMQFLGKFGKFTCWCPPGELVPTPWGNPRSATDQSCALEVKNRSKQLLLKVHTSISFIHPPYNCPHMDIINMHSVVIAPSISVLLGKTMEASY